MLSCVNPQHDRNPAFYLEGQLKSQANIDNHLFSLLLQSKEGLAPFLDQFGVQ